MFDSPMQIMLVVGIVVLLFGAGKLPQLAKSIGQSKKAFQDGIREAEADEAAASQAKLTAAPAPQITSLSDEELMTEMRRRVETNTAAK